MDDQHGTMPYARNCDQRPRCPSCRRALAAYMRQWRARVRRRQGKNTPPAVRSTWPATGLGWPPG